MDFFNKSYQFARYFYSNAQFNILCVGYDDFNFLKPGYLFRKQSFYTWHFIISGSGTLEICDKKYHLKSGDMFFIPPDVKMRYFPNPNDRWRYVWFSLKGDITKQYGELLGFDSKNFAKENKNSQKINNILSKMLTSLLDNQIEYFGVLSSFYKIMDICTIRSANTGIETVKEIIDENFTIPTFSVEKLCHDVGFSHAHLLRLFKKEYGSTIVQYVIKKRLELACELLQTTDLSVNQVGCSCGFSDEIHFIKTFKKAMNLSALEFRKKYKK